MYDDKARDDTEKYQDKGVEDEDGLRKFVESGDEDEEDDDKKEEDNEEDDDHRTKDGKDKGLIVHNLFCVMCLCIFPLFQIAVIEFSRDNRSFRRLLCEP